MFAPLSPPLRSKLPNPSGHRKGREKDRSPCGDLFRLLAEDQGEGRTNDHAKKHEGEACVFDGATAVVTSGALPPFCGRAAGGGKPVVAAAGAVLE